MQMLSRLLISFKMRINIGARSWNFVLVEIFMLQSRKGEGVSFPFFFFLTYAASQPSDVVLLQRNEPK